MNKLTNLLLILRGGPPDPEGKNIGSGNWIRHTTQPYNNKDEVVNFHQTQMELQGRNSAIDYYSKLGFIPINWALRHDEDDMEQAAIAKMLTSFKPLPVNATVYRCMVAAYLPPVGSVFEDKGFGSTSLLRKIVDDFSTSHSENRTTYTIHVPQGHSVAYANHNGEKEIIMRPNTKYKVLPNNELQVIG